MSKYKKILCITHSDLDGMGSYLLLKWTFPKVNVELLPTTVYQFRETFINWQVNNKLSDYEKVFVMDLDVFDDADLIDDKKFFIIDHHGSHVKNMGYKNATTVIVEYSSCMKLVYKTFQKLYNIDLTIPQKRLVALVDDYDSYTLACPESKKLNIVFWSSDNKFKQFEKNFISGFHGFNHKHENLVRLYELRLDKLREELQIYHANLMIESKKRDVYAAMCGHSINDVADILLSDYNANVAIVVNPNSEHVSFRKSRTDYDKDLNLAVLASKLADGAGHEYASGGNLTEKMMSFLKLLSPIS